MKHFLRGLGPLAAGAVLLVMALSWPVTLWAQQTVTPDQVDQVAKQLWCPLCNSVRLDVCDLKACVQMRDLIAEKLAAGESTDTIRAYFVTQYGPQVLGEPPRQGFNWVAWIVPFAVLVAAAAWLYTVLRRWTRHPTPARSGPAALRPDLTPEQLQRLQEELKTLD